MKLLHTSDWHLGQTFYEYSRDYEHQHFLEWLTATIAEKEIDVLLVCGDVFDVSNPASASVTMFYKFLMGSVHSRPGLQVIVIAGNHDSPSRLEAPKPLLEYSNITIVGNPDYLPDGSINLEKLIIPIKNISGKVEAWCIAMPFIRPGDYSSTTGFGTSYPDGIHAIYKEAYEYAISKKQTGEGLIALGHLHTSGAEVSGNDKSERPIMGGVDFVPITAFDDHLAYTALGHIHKAQKVGGKENIRYSGSPLPMSFSERDYKHQVILLEMGGEHVLHIESIEVPVKVKLLSVPKAHKPLKEVLTELSCLPRSSDIDHAPYLEVRVLLESPEPSLRHQVETALKGKNARLAKIDVKYPVGIHEEEEAFTFEKLQELQPVSVFSRVYKSRFKNEVPKELIALFNEVTSGINLTGE
jgi:DNA repair protein SbcD/Mre11